VWETLTTPKGLEKWLSETARMDDKAGGIFSYKGNFVYGWQPGRDFASRIVTYESPRELAFEFPLHHRSGTVTQGIVRFTLEAAGKHTTVKFSYEFDDVHDLHPHSFNDLWAYYLNIITNVCEHEFHEPGLLFDFTRPWTGNIKHVLYITGYPDQVFGYLHKPELLSRYFTDVKMFEPFEEGRIDFGWGQGQGPTRVLQFEDPAELAYDWPVQNGTEIEIGKVKWTIEPEGRQVRLEMKQSGFSNHADHYTSGEALGWATLMLEIRRMVESGRPALNLAGQLSE
jgi:uncharacterized protein YndB with AHSA1/START domain